MSPTTSAPSCAPPGILFISHTADRTGAPIGLLHLIRWLNAETAMRCAVLCKEPGPLVPELERLVPTLVDPGIESLVWRGIRKVGAASPATILRRGRLSSLLDRIGRIDLVYSNTLTNGALLAELAPLGTPVISHCHELEHWIRHRIQPDDLAATMGATTAYIAASTAVADNLEHRHGVDPSKLTVIHEYVDLDAIDASDRDLVRAEVRAEFGIPGDAFVVGGAGTTDPRKGTDVFVQLAPRTPPNVHFLWIGGDEPVCLAQHRRDADLMGVGGRVHLVGERADAPACFSAFDVLALTSREDPYPLVMLECAALGMPMVCFEAAGGGPEFASGGVALTVPYLDVEAMAAALNTLTADPALARNLAQQAQNKVRRENRLDVAAPKIEAVIRSQLVGNHG